jgi:hypothetical protein
MKKISLALFFIFLITTGIASSAVAEEIKSVQKIASETANSCWPCDLLIVIMGGLDKTISYAHTVLLKPSLQLLALGFALWIVWLFLKFFASFGASTDYIQLFSDLFTKTLLVLFVAACMKMSDLSTLQDLIITPLLSASTAYSKLIAADTNTTDSLSAKLSSALHLQFDSKYCTATNPKTDLGLVSSDFLTPELQQHFLCTISSINQQFMPPLMIGKIFYLYGTGHPVSLSPERISSNNEAPNYVKSGVDFSYIFPAITMLVVFNLILFLIPFYLLDAITTLCFTLALLPLFLIACPFKFTQEYTKKAWSLFVYSLLIFITLSTVVPIVLEMYYVLFSQDDITGIINTFSHGDDNEKIAALKTIFVESHGSFYMILLTIGWCYMSIKFLKMTEKLAKKLSDDVDLGGNTSAALGKSAIGAASMAGAVAQKGLSAATGGATEIAKKGFDAVKNTVKKSAQSTKDST